MNGRIVADRRQCNCSIGRFLDEHGNTPVPPDPAWALFVDGQHLANFRQGEERALIEAYFRAAREAAA